MMTFKELKKLVKLPLYKEQRVPTVKALEESGVSVVAEKILENHGSISVYQNGYVIYRAHKRVTVFSLRNCVHYKYDADGVLLRDAYIEKKKVLSEKLATLQDSIRIEKEEQECADELDEEIRALTKQASEKTYIGGLTKECVDAFVSMVYLYDDQTMKVEFNCEDVIRRALEKYGA